ncbi:MAG: TIGR02611 family protein [Pseudonocardiaceae bacterium]
MGTKPDKAGDAPAPTADLSPLRHPFRAFFGRHRSLDLTYRVVVGILGTAVVVGGIVLIPLPGPGWLIVFAGLALLSTEFAWAERLLAFARGKVLGWTSWVGRQSILVRAAIGLGGVLIVAVALWVFVTVQGVPGWLPVV